MKKPTKQELIDEKIEQEYLYEGLSSMERAAKAQEPHYSNCCDAIFMYPDYPDNDFCSECGEHALPAEQEKEYSVTVKASFGVIATSREDAEQYILDKFCSGNINYTGNVEVEGNKDEKI